VGTQFRIMHCTNIVTEEPVNYTRCGGAAPVTGRNCKPPLCPCGPPPEIIGGDNVTIARRCPSLESGGSCSAVCQEGFIVIGEFRCYAGSYVEMAECVPTGQPVLTVPGITFNVRLNDIETDMSGDIYLIEIAPAIRLTTQQIIQPVEVQFPEEEIKMRIRSIPPSGNRSLAGRLLQGIDSSEAFDSSMGEDIESSLDGIVEVHEPDQRALNETSRWRVWEEVYFKNKAKNSTNQSQMDAAPDETATAPGEGIQLALTNFSGHRATPGELVGLAVPGQEGTSTGGASASIASRLMAQRRQSNASAKDVEEQETAVVRRMVS